MKPETLFESLQHLDERILEESELPVRRSWKRWAAAAACICVVAIGVFTALRMGEAAKWNAVMDTFEPNDLIGETDPVSPSSPIAGEADEFEAHTGTETPPETDAPSDRLPQHVPLFWNDADPVAADAAPVAGVIIVSEPMTKAQIEMTAPDEFPEWLRFPEGYASYYLKDGAGGLQGVFLTVKNDLRGIDATLRIFDPAAPDYGGGCLTEPRPDTVTGGYDYLEWYITYADENDLARLTSPEERTNYDLSLYPIPRGESVPREKWEIVERPVFRSEELTPGMVKARAYTVSDAGDTDGWRMRFSVLFPGGVLVRIDAKGLSPEWIFEQVSQLG